MGGLPRQERDQGCVELGDMADIETVGCTVDEGEFGVCERLVRPLAGPFEGDGGVTVTMDDQCWNSHRTKV